MILNDIEWSWKPFDKLVLKEWHDLLQLRINVFVVEQNCPYPELDGKDVHAIHVMGSMKDSIAAVARILPKGLSYPEVSIGRVAIAPEFRGKGLGNKLMETCLEVVKKAFGDVPIRISAQTYLIDFYTSLGFAETGKRYLEDGIPHAEMLRKATNDR